MVLLGQGSNLCGELRMIDMQQQFFATDFPKQCLLKQMSEPCQMTLFDLSQYQICLSSAVLARIFPQLDVEQELMAFVEACFLKDSDFYDLKSFKLSSLKTCKEFSAAVTAQTSKKSSQRLGNWGMWGDGNSETAIAGCHKTDHESSLLVISGNIQCRKIEPDRRTLQECLDDGETIVDQSPSSSRTLDDSAPSEKASAVQKKAVVYRSATGDRLYTEVALTLRSLANTGGKHQGGGGAWKVVEYNGEDGIVPNEIEDICLKLKPFLV